MRYKKCGPTLSSAAQAERTATVQWLRDLADQAPTSLQPLTKFITHEADAIEAGLHRAEQRGPA